MFLIPANEQTEEHEAITLFAEDFNFAVLWHQGPLEKDTGEVHQNINRLESLLPVF